MLRLKSVDKMKRKYTHYLVNHPKLRAWIRAFVASFLIIIWLFMGAGCLSTNPRDEAFFELIPPIEVNNGLQLELAEIPSNSQSEDVIALLLMNRTDISISFAPGFGSQLYAYIESTQNWTEIRNLVDYRGGEEILEPRTADLSSNWAALVLVSPELVGIGQPAFLRILVVGRALENGNPSERRIGAYVEIEIGG